MYAAPDHFEWWPESNRLIREGVSASCRTFLESAMPYSRRGKVDGHSSSPERQGHWTHPCLQMAQYRTFFLPSPQLF
ncbi:hypothetical protein E2C01_091756 [Portunus trituberculatus]|uniref:Uncharacterized protein n=1 Tax=Portunus trituberculatus TaxID=210409 RepID=A0A5B7JVX5_PORTR|nr:hypothetical protein [Portunus trituberculatus]